MRDQQKERLIEIIQNSVGGCARNWAEVIADGLLSEGVIVPPCKVGQKVFKIVKLYGDSKSIMVEGEVFEIALTHENGEIKKRFYFLERDGNKIINRYSLWLDFEESGKTVFLTKEEAERALGKEDEMSREDFEGIREYAKEQHAKRVADNPNRIQYAIEQFEKHNIEYVLKNEQTGHFHCHRKSDDKLFQFYAGTGKIMGYDRKRGIHALIELLDPPNRERR